MDNNIVDDELTNVFLEEAEEILNNLQPILDKWLHDNNNSELLDALQRDLHTFKGGARMVNQELLGGVAHHLESVYMGIKNNTIAVNSKICNMILKTHDLLRSMINILASKDSQISKIAGNKSYSSSNEEDVKFKYSQLNDINIMLSEASMQSIKVARKVNNKDVAAILAQQNVQHKNIADILLHVQMVPFSSVVPRLNRIAENVSKELGKQVNFNISYDSGEIGRDLFNKLVPTLEHMLRNSLDHGIEEQDTRVNYNKDPTGNINIKFSQSANNVIIDFCDDGSGIDAKVVLNKAIKSGIVAADAVLSNREIFALLFAPGFSTRDRVTEISGRGVGLDVVNSAIKELGGNINIDSKLHFGTTFVITVPFSSMLTDVLTFKVSSFVYGIALSNIVAISRILADNPSVNMKDITYANKKYPIVYLDNVLHSNGNSYPVLILRSTLGDFALVVDQIIKNSKILIKPMGKQCVTLQKYAGCGITDDHSLVMILDPNNLYNAVYKSNIIADKKLTKILVVDDSITVRKASKHLLERNGYEVVLAENGVDALHKLKKNNIAIVLSDLEMPEMNGFDLVKNMRNNDKLQHIPVIMISSRSGNLHKHKALSLGVNVFLGKPFQHKALLQEIRKLLK